MLGLCLNYFAKLVACFEGLISNKFLYLFSDFETTFCAITIISPSSNINLLCLQDSKIIELKLSPG